MHVIKETNLEASENHVDRLHQNLLNLGHLFASLRCGVDGFEGRGWSGEKCRTHKTFYCRFKIKNCVNNLKPRVHRSVDSTATATTLQCKYGLLGELHSIETTSKYYGTVTITLAIPSESLLDSLN
jgi:hypothetical protein